MKFIKSLTILSLSVLMSVSAYADSQKQKAKAAEKAQTTEAQQLKRFTDSIELQFLGIEITQEKDQQLVHFNYKVQNKAKRSIKQVHWATTYLFNKQPVLIQDVPISFNQLLKPKASLPLTFSLPFANLPKEAQNAFSDPKNVISVQFQAKTILFSNGSKIEVK